jgi:trans-aconitate 2-methyltransferase
VARPRLRADLDLKQKEAALAGSLVGLVVDRLCESRPATMNDHYTFGDNDHAAERLALLARAFEPSSKRLLESVTDVHGSPPERALDLGCGPGFTTELVQQVVGAGQTWGVDASARLIERARSRAEPPIRYAVHDVTVAPFPIAGVGFAYARYLLNHIASPRSALVACAGAMRRGGLLVLEENCALESADALFINYYACVEVLQRHYGQDMYIGERLPTLAEGTAFVVRRFERTRIPLDARTMARLHAMNVRTWARDPFAISTFDARELAAMARELDAVADGRRAALAVKCAMGQAVMRCD